MRNKKRVEINGGREEEKDKRRKKVTNGRSFTRL